MSSFPPDAPREEVNYYTAPRAEIGGEASLAGDHSEAEAIRRRYLSHEASVRSIGSLHYLGAIFGVVLLAIFTFMLIEPPAGAVGGPFGSGGIGVLIGIAALFTGISFALGRGLSRLQPWARYVDTALIILNLLSNFVQLALLPPAARGAGMIGGAFGMAIPSYILYLLLSSKGSMVFSREYREIVAVTPHIKYKTSLLLKLFLGFFVAVIVLAVIGALIVPLLARR